MAVRYKFAMRQTCVKATFTAPCNAPALLPALPPAAAPRHVARTALRQIGAAHEPLSALYRLVRPDTRLSDTPIYSYRTLRYMTIEADGRESDVKRITGRPSASSLPCGKLAERPLLPRHSTHCVPPSLAARSYRARATPHTAFLPAPPPAATAPPRCPYVIRVQTSAAAVPYPPSTSPYYRSHNSHPRSSQPPRPQPTAAEDRQVTKFRELETCSGRADGREPDVKSVTSRPSAPPRAR